MIRVLGDEASDALASAYQGTVSAAVEANNGVVLERAGDQVNAVFHSAGDAVLAAAAAREALRDFEWPQGCNVAFKAVLDSARWSGDPRQPVAGTAFVRLIRLDTVVEPGQILVSQATASLIEGDRRVPPLRSIGERVMADLDEPMRLYELLDS